MSRRIVLHKPRLCFLSVKWGFQNANLLGRAEIPQTDVCKNLLWVGVPTKETRSSPKPGSCECDRCGKWGLCTRNEVKMRSHWIEVGPNLMPGVPVRTGTFRYRHTKRGGGPGNKQFSQVFLVTQGPRAHYRCGLSFSTALLPMVSMSQKWPLGT